MEQIGILTLMLVLGFGLGALYFLGLWLTIKDLPTQKRWGWRMVVSMLIRTSLVAGAFIYLMGHDWQRLAALAVGFWLARLLMVRRIKTNFHESRTGAP